MANLKESLRKLTKDLNILRVLEAKRGNEPSIRLLNQIDDHKKAIELTKQAIAGEISEAEWEEALGPLTGAPAVARLLGEEQFQAIMLQNYLDKMTELLLDYGLRESQPGDTVRNIARTHTLSVLRVLDSARNRTVVRFLREAELFEPGEEAVVNLAKSALERTKLERVNFDEADLHWADLSLADLSFAYLTRANLSEAKLIRADLSRANLFMANLIRADLSLVNLNRAVLIGAFLSEADLHGG